MLGSFKNNLARSRLIEEKMYEKAYDEIERGELRKGLYAKALANSDGIPEKANALYVKYRVESMYDEEQLLESALNEAREKNTSSAERSTREYPTLEAPEIITKKQQSELKWLIGTAVALTLIFLSIVLANK